MPGFRRNSCLFAAISIANVCGWLMAADLRDAQLDVIYAKGRTHVIAVEAGPFPAVALANISKRPDAQEVFGRVLSVFVDSDEAGETAILGTYSVDEQTLRFRPRFDFRAGQAHRAMLRASEIGLPGAAPVATLTLRFKTPDEARVPPTEVAAIFPSAAVIPENQLRFYLHFSAPMARGAAYEHVRLLDDKNQPVNLPFLELGQELWDPGQQRLTLLIDPGRIKRGVKPREDMGPVLRSGGEFTLVVHASWPDAQNRPLRKEFAKRFRVGPPIEEAIVPAQWQLRAPASGTREPLAIDFPRPLDHALLERLLTVCSASGAHVQGDVVISREEHRWEFRPAQAWPLGKFAVVVDTALEDLAGNRIGRAFEVDQTGPITKRVQADTVRLEFETRTGM